MYVYLELKCLKGWHPGLIAKVSPKISLADEILHAVSILQYANNSHQASFLKQEIHISEGNAELTPADLPYALAVKLQAADWLGKPGTSSCSQDDVCKEFQV